MKTTRNTILTLLLAGWLAGWGLLPAWYCDCAPVNAEIVKAQTVPSPCGSTDGACCCHMPKSKTESPQSPTPDELPCPKISQMVNMIQNSTPLNVEQYSQIHFYGLLLDINPQEALSNRLAVGGINKLSPPPPNLSLFAKKTQILT